MPTGMSVWMIVLACGAAVSSVSATQPAANTQPPANPPTGPSAPTSAAPATSPPAQTTPPAGAAAQDDPSVRPGEDTRPMRAEPGDNQGWVFEFRSDAEYTFEGDLDESDGSVSIFRAGLGLGMSAPMGDKARFLLNVGSEWSNYDFKDVTGLLVPGDGNGPMEDGWLVRIGPGVVYQFNEAWGVTGGGIIELGWEDGADMGDAATYGGYGGVRYSWGPGQSVTLGAIAKTRLEDDSIVVPLIGLEWQLTDRLILENDGLGVRLTAQISDQWRASIFGRYELREYRLSDDGDVPEGVMSDARVPVGVGLMWRPNAHVSVRGYAGAMVYQKYEIDNSGGHEVADDETDPAAFVGLTVRIAF